MKLPPIDTYNRFSGTYRIELRFIIDRYGGTKFRKRANSDIFSKIQAFTHRRLIESLLCSPCHHIRKHIRCRNHFKLCRRKEFLPHLQNLLPVCTLRIDTHSRPFRKLRQIHFRSRRQCGNGKKTSGMRNRDSSVLSVQKRRAVAKMAYLPIYFAPVFRIDLICHLPP